jgi:hypothetical protein
MCIWSILGEGVNPKNGVCLFFLGEYQNCKGLRLGWGENPKSLGGARRVGKNHEILGGGG